MNYVFPVLGLVLIVGLIMAVTEITLRKAALAEDLQHLKSEHQAAIQKHEAFVTKHEDAIDFLQCEILKWFDRFGSVRVHKTDIECIFAHFEEKFGTLQAISKSMLLKQLELQKCVIDSQSNEILILRSNVSALGTDSANHQREAALRTQQCQQLQALAGQVQNRVLETVAGLRTKGSISKRRISRCQSEIYTSFLPLTQNGTPKAADDDVPF